MIAVSWGSATERGPRRNNQDAFLAEPPVFVVADGMGWARRWRARQCHRGGDLPHADRAGRGASGRGVGADHQANETILERAEADPGLRGMAPPWSDW